MCVRRLSEKPVRVLYWMRVTMRGSGTGGSGSVVPAKAICFPSGDHASMLPAFERNEFDRSYFETRRNLPEDTFSTHTALWPSRLPMKAICFPSGDQWMSCGSSGAFLISADLPPETGSFSRRVVVVFVAASLVDTVNTAASPSGEARTSPIDGIATVASMVIGPDWAKTVAVKTKAARILIRTHFTLLAAPRRAAASSPKKNCRPPWLRGYYLRAEYWHSKGHAEMDLSALSTGCASGDGAGGLSGASAKAVEAIHRNRQPHRYAAASADWQSGYRKAIEPRPRGSAALAGRRRARAILCAVGSDVFQRRRSRAPHSRPARCDAAGSRPVSGPDRACDQRCCN